MEEVSLSELFNLVMKKECTTIYERQLLEHHLVLFQNKTYDLRIKERNFASLDSAQIKFVKHVLPYYIRHGVDNFYKVLCLFNLDANNTLVLI